MYASVSPVFAKPEQLDDFLSVCGTTVLPSLSAEPGFISGSVVSAPSTNAAYIISLWNSAAERDNAEERNRSTQIAALTPYLVQAPKPEPFEILVQAGAQTGAIFARLITLPVPNEHIGSAIRVYEEEYLPLLQAQPGFLRVMWLANRTDGTGWGISFWLSHQQMQAADQEGEFFPKVLARLAVYFSGKPEMGYYAVDELCVAR